LLSARHKREEVARSGLEPLEFLETLIAAQAVTPTTRDILRPPSAELSAQLRAYTGLPAREISNTGSDHSSLQPVLNPANLQNQITLPAPLGNSFYRLKTP
jgi:hypothetical protein